MRRAMNGIPIAIALVCFAAAAPAAQWLKQPTPGIPRTADGKANLSAPAPRLPDGKPDLSGLWQPAAILIGDIADEPSAELGAVPAVGGEAVQRAPRQRRPRRSRRRTASSAACRDRMLVPYPFKVLHEKNLVVILYEAVHSYRQIFADGRSLPADMNPSWFGYSSRAVGEGHLRRRDRRVQRQGVARQLRQARDRQAARDRDVRAQGLRAHGHPDHDRRSGGLHETVGRDAAAHPAARYGAARIHLQREQQVLRHPSEEPKSNRRRRLQPARDAGAEAPALRNSERRS